MCFIKTREEAARRGKELRTFFTSYAIIVETTRMIEISKRISRKIEKKLFIKQQVGKFRVGISCHWTGSKR